MEGAEEAYAVEGTPGEWLRPHPLCTASAVCACCAHLTRAVRAAIASLHMRPSHPPSGGPTLAHPAADSVMIALYGPLLRNPSFNLVVSGINRGDNCGLHVIYSGTVGAAREAACKVRAWRAFRGLPKRASLHSRLCGLQKRTYSAFNWWP